VISKLVIKDRKRACLEWLAGSDLFKGKRTFTFKEGLNILVGPNGSGKSTILNLLGSMMLCLDFGVARIDEMTVDRVVKRHSKFNALKDLTRKDFRDGVRPVHDGQPVIYINPDKVFGLGGRGAFFTDVVLGCQNMFAQKEASSGEYAKMQLAERLQDRPESLDLSKMWGDQEKHKALREFWEKPDIEEPGQPTVLIDEADRSLDLLNQLDLWTFLKLAGLPPKGRGQFIVASHCVAAFDIPGAHYIELEKGYRGKCLKKVEKLREVLSQEAE
jgi:predicted ATPase